MGDDLVQHRLQRLIRWRWFFDEDWRAVGTAPVYAVQYQAVRMDVQIRGRAEVLDWRDAPLSASAKNDQLVDATVAL